MKHYDRTLKQLFVYILGLFILTLGISLSIYAGLGVSPVSSLAYALTLVTSISIGITTVLANLVFIVVQWILTKTFKLRSYTVQLLVSILFGLFTDVTLSLTQAILPVPESMTMRIVYLILSLFVMGLGLLGYLSAKMPLMPYDALTYVISDTFHFAFSKAKITGDVLNVLVAAVLCLVTIHSFGSIGFGTLIAAVLVGKIIGFYMKIWQKPLVRWMLTSKFN
ncbi:YczE/YyaS/YitT family protein [Kurthia senegalensis]|uniref:YczE/YyaS/YitT family protein n=1 Tax=Kurthia senegalensis TaxID=1033740 RepID=UPI00028A3DA7|nr:DUF6198 family protein [Kurthia senegalensis]